MLFPPPVFFLCSFSFVAYFYKFVKKSKEKREPSIYSISAIGIATKTRQLFFPFTKSLLLSLLFFFCVCSTSPPQWHHAVGWFICTSTFLYFYYVFYPLMYILFLLVCSLFLFLFSLLSSPTCGTITHKRNALPLALIFSNLIKANI